MAKLGDEELVLAKEECVRLGECAATYYIVHLLSEVEEQREREKRMRVLDFGRGALVVTSGTYGEFPAVFLEPTDRPGPIGEHATGYEGSSLVAGSVVILARRSDAVEVLIEALRRTQKRIAAAQEAKPIRAWHIREDGEIYAGRCSEEEMKKWFEAEWEGAADYMREVSPEAMDAEVELLDEESGEKYKTTLRREAEEAGDSLPAWISTTYL